MSRVSDVRAVPDGPDRPSWPGAHPTGNLGRRSTEPPSLGEARSRVVRARPTPPSPDPHVPTLRPATLRARPGRGVRRLPLTGAGTAALPPALTTALTTAPGRLAAGLATLLALTAIPLLPGVAEALSSPSLHVAGLADPGLIPTGLSAQEAPSAAGDALEPVPDTLDLPPHEEAVLPNGLRVIVVRDTAMTTAVWTLLVPGGSAADPEGREGTAAALAGLVDRLAGHDPGLTLAATASADAVAVTLVDSTAGPLTAARRVADAVARVPITDTAVASVRAAALERLRDAARSPAVVGSRALDRAVYGDHPYGRHVTEASLARIDGEGLRRWRERYLRPRGAVLAVAGPASMAELRPAIEAAVEGWEGEPPDEPAGRPLRPVPPPRRLLVHHPGSATAVVYVGIPLPTPSGADWTALALLDQLLSGSTESRLFTIDPPGGGEAIVAGTSTGAQRRRGPGIFRAGASVRVGVAAEVVGGLLAGLAAAGDRPAMPDELRPAQERLAASFAEQLRRSEAAAALLAVNRLLGLPDSAMTTYPGRVRRVGVQRLGEVAGAHIDTARASVVVVGDARLLAESLADPLVGVGDFTLVDARGADLTLAELEPFRGSSELAAGLLEPATLVFRVMVGGVEAGRVRRTLASGPDSLPGTLVYRSSVDLGGQGIEQSVTFTASGLRPVRAEASIRGAAGAVRMTGRAEGDRFVGRVSGGGGEQRIDAPLPEDALVGDLVELAAWILPPEEGATFRIPALTPETGRIEAVIYRVGPIETVTVPAGTFQARRIELLAGEDQTLWIRTDGAPVPVRIRPAGRPVTLELVEVAPPEGDP